MPRITSIPSPPEEEVRRWREEYLRTIVELRKKVCSFTDRLEIWVPTILFQDCFGAEVDGIFLRYRGPDVLPESWESDLAIALDEDVAASMAEDEDCPRCHYCRYNLRGRALYVETTELSEGLGISDAAPIKATKKRKQVILEGYGRRCFACGSDGPLGIDHIQPRSCGGTASLDNLQPLCSKCGQAKSDSQPQQIVVVRDPWSS
jgi:5-methylcytosine-specific restriction endonuclease McrA